MNYTTKQIKKMYDGIPKIKMMLGETPLHKLETISKDYGINLYMKREDLAGPSTFSGNKMRKLEFTMGQAVKDGIKYVTTFGAYQSNSAMQIATAANICGIKPILYLGDTKEKGEPTVFTGNLLVSKMLGAEIHYVSKPDDNPEDSNSLNGLWEKCINLCMEKEKELIKNGELAMFIPVGSTHKSAWISDVLTFAEMIEQSQALGFKIDYIYHTNGSCGTLPGLIAAKLMMGSNIELRSINVRSWKPGQLITKETCYERVKAIFEQLNIPCPSKDKIYEQMNVDERFIGPAYGVPNPLAQDCIKELALKEGMFIDPTYTGKGFLGLKTQLEEGKIPKGSNVVFIHTGGLLSLFSDDLRLTEDLIK